MNNLLLPVMMMAALGLMMFFSVRKQKRQVAETKRMQESILPGSRVMTTSGLHATVSAIADDTIELEIAPGVFTTWVRAAVREVVVPAVEVPDDLSAGGITDDEVAGRAPLQSDNNPAMLQKRTTDLG